MKNLRHLPTIIGIDALSLDPSPPSPITLFWLAFTARKYQHPIPDHSLAPLSTYLLHILHLFPSRIQILHIMCHAVSLIGTAGVAAVAVLSLLPDANAFAPNARPAFSSAPLYGELERVKSAGSGTDVAFPVGDFRLFDPEAEGKLQGTGSLSQRIQAGADYVLPPTFPDGTYLAAGGGINGAAGVESSPPEGAVAMDAQHWLEHLDDNLPVNFAKPNTPVTATLLARQVSLSCSMICCTVAASHMSPVTDSFITFI